MRRRLAAALLLAAAAASSAACSTERRIRYGETSRDYMERSRDLLEGALEHDMLSRVKPWERDLLAREEMAWEPDPLLARRHAHIYFSKEGSLVGGGAGGGGCGCN
jgi:hypothetical protein